MKPRIYCDMDGVLCDFKTAAQKATGMPISKWMYSSKTEKCNLSKTLQDFGTLCRGKVAVDNYGLLFQNINLTYYQHT